MVSDIRISLGGDKPLSCVGPHSLREGINPSPIIGPSEPLPFYIGPNEPLPYIDPCFYGKG